MPGGAEDTLLEASLGIVVVNYGSSVLLENNLRPLSTSLPQAVVVVVDSFTTTEERRAVEVLVDAQGWTLVSPGHNVGFGGGMNLGVSEALDRGCSHLLLLNPDVTVDAGAVRQLLAVARACPDTLLTPLIERRDGSTWFAGGQLDRRRGLTRSRPDTVQRGPDRWLTGACLVVERSAWETLGGFDPAYFLYWEDIDLSQRYLALGGDLRVVPDVRAVHDVGGTQREGGKSPGYCRYNCRNRLRFAAANLPPSARLRWVLHAPRYAGRVLQRNGRRGALLRPGHALAAAWGTVEGLALIVASVGRDRRRRT